MSGNATRKSFVLLKNESSSNHRNFGSKKQGVSKLTASAWRQSLDGMATAFIGLGHVQNHSQMQPQLKRFIVPGTQAGLQNKKILLLEDEEDFRGIIKEFLESHFYDVVTAKNGVEGVREIMAGDFEVILCDMMMPTLPGDMFYLAVERMRPHLCDRFIFMTGHKGDSKVSDFIQKVSGIILNKPFQIEDLLEMIAFVQVRTNLRF